MPFSFGVFSIAFLKYNRMMQPNPSAYQIANHPRGSRHCSVQFAFFKEQRSHYPRRWKPQTSDLWARQNWQQSLVAKYAVWKKCQVGTVRKLWQKVLGSKALSEKSAWHTSKFTALGCCNCSKAGNPEKQFTPWKGTKQIKAKEKTNSNFKLSFTSNFKIYFQFQDY